MDNVNNETFVYMNNLIIKTPKLVQNGINNDDNYRNEFFKIRECVDAILEGDNEDRYIIMPGLRGVGKTTIIFQIYNYLLNERNIPEKKIIIFGFG